MSTERSEYAVKSFFINAFGEKGSCKTLCTAIRLFTKDAVKQAPHRAAG